MSVSLYLIGFGQLKFWYYLHLNYHKSWWSWRWDVPQIKVCIQCGAVWADGQPSRATFRLLSRTTTSKYQVKCGSEVFVFVFAAFISLSFTASHLKTSSETWVKNIWLIFVSIDAQYSQPFPNHLKCGSDVFVFATFRLLSIKASPIHKINNLWWGTKDILGDQKDPKSAVGGQTAMGGGQSAK